MRSDQPAKVPATTEKLSCCPVCGSEKRRLLFRGPDAFLAGKGIERHIRYDFCVGCSQVYANPRLDHADLTEVYDDRYWEADSYELSGGRWRLKPGFVRDRINVAVERHAYFEQAAVPNKPRRGRGSRMLEVGSGAGFLLSLFQREGWKVQGVEPTPLALFAAEAGAPSRREFFDPGGFETPPLDLAALMQVFEHLADPVGFLRRLRGLLKPQGLLWLEIPSLLCPRPADLSNPHLFFYSPNTIRGVLGRAGYSVLLCEPYHSRNAAFQVMHVFGRPGRRSRRTAKDDYVAVRRTIERECRLQRRKESQGELVGAYERVRLPAAKIGRHEKR